MEKAASIVRRYRTCLLQVPTEPLIVRLVTGKLKLSPFHSRRFLPDFVVSGTITWQVLIANYTYAVYLPAYLSVARARFAAVPGRVTRSRERKGAGLEAGGCARALDAECRVSAERRDSQAERRELLDAKQEP